MLSAVFVLSLAASLAVAHPAKRQTESSQAQITDPAQECQTYDYPPMDALASKYPTPYVTAQILSNDTTAQALFNQINTHVSSTLPNDQPMGGGNYPSDDPDCWFSYQQCTTPAASTGLEPDMISLSIPNAYGLTIDDGPACDHNALYDFLAANNQKATLFYIGSNIMSYPLQALRGFDDGHQICVHTWSHQYTTHLTNEQVFAELYYARQIIKDLMGVTPKCWRPPYGDVDNRVRAFAAGLNLTTIIWNQDTSDWSLDSGTPVSTVDANYEAIIGGVKSNQYTQAGPIVLCHELSNATMSELVKFYPQIKAAFSYVLPIATALNDSHPYVETSWSYPTLQQYIQGNINQTNGTVSPGISASASSIVSTSTFSSGDQRASSTAVSVSASVSATAVKTSSNAQKTPNSGSAQRTVSIGMLLGLVSAVALI